MCPAMTEVAEVTASGAVARRSGPGTRSARRGVDFVRDIDQIPIAVTDGEPTQTPGLRFEFVDDLGTRRSIPHARRPRHRQTPPTSTATATARDR